MSHESNGDRFKEKSEPRIAFIFIVIVVLWVIVIPFIRWVALGDIPKDMKSLKSEISALHKDVKNLQSEISSLNSEISWLRSDISTLTSALKSKN
jgi:peptidoglycan hydrolase CwlO-like protein